MTTYRADSDSTQKQLDALEGPYREKLYEEKLSRLSEDAQLVSISAFLKANGLTKHLKSRNWAAFAKIYNGSDFAKNKYDVKLEGAFQHYSSGALPDVEIRRAQLYLNYLGYTTGGVDGLNGKLSRAAIKDFRSKNDLANTEAVDQKLLAALKAKVAAL